MDFKQGFVGVVFSIISLGLVACEQPLKVDPQVVAGDFYASLKNKNFEQASELFSAGMEKRVSHQAWIEFMAGVQADLGNLTGVRFKNIETNTVRTGRMFIFDVAASYENGNAAETLSLFQGLSATDLEAVAYEVKANGLTVHTPR
ncbi:hypothetical protein JYT96_00790 [Gammaproteobacteria bacterium AH-315-C21]|nr:hypothetical protein [Gammaproteobacteria bacterium AH-315-C21]